MAKDGATEGRQGKELRRQSYEHSAPGQRRAWDRLWALLLRPGSREDKREAQATDEDEGVA